MYKWQFLDEALEIFYSVRNNPGVSFTVWFNLSSYKRLIWVYFRQKNCVKWGSSGACLYYFFVYVSVMVSLLADTTKKERVKEGQSRPTLPVSISVRNCLDCLNLYRRLILNVGGLIPRFWAVDHIRVEENTWILAHAICFSLLFHVDMTSCFRFLPWLSCCDGLGVTRNSKLKKPYFP